MFCVGDFHNNAVLCLLLWKEAEDCSVSMDQMYRRLIFVLHAAISQVNTLFTQPFFDCSLYELKNMFHRYSGSTGDLSQQ